MKHALPLLVVLAGAATPALAEPLLNSWHTDHSGAYARIYETTTDETAGNAVTTWNRGQGVQTLPTYCGIHEISSTATHVYIRTTGLASYVMGPWYLNAAKTNLFPNYPANMAVLYEFAKDPGVPPASKVPTGLGAIGYFVDGVAMFDSRDAFSYDTSAGQDEAPNSPGGVVGDDIWNRDAFVNESVTFDSGNAHQAGRQHHYHANPPGLRHQLGDSVDHIPATNTYTENFNGQHSPIIGWVRDSYPVYGPYGYDDPNVLGGTVRRMISGYQDRDGTNGSTDLNTTGRTSLPAWAVSVQGIGPALAAGQFGPPVNATYPLGHYIEDYAYKGDLGMTLGTDFDLDVHNGRFCKTPEFPGGTYAYFYAIEPDGTPVYPYNIGRTYYGNPTGTTVASVPAGAVTHFEGGPEIEEQLKSSSIDDPSGDVTVVWSAAEGGTYDIQSGSTPDALASLPSTVDAVQDTVSIVDAGRGLTDDRYFYRAGRLSLDSFDDTGFDYGSGGTAVFTATFATTPPLPPLNAVTSITVGGVVATILSYDQVTGVVDLDFDDSSLAPGLYNAVLTFIPPGGSETMLNSTNQYEVLPPNTDPNILIMIVDDWGIDASPIDNFVGAGGATFLPNMPNLQNLAATGLRFTQAYVTPVCSPTRSCIMTGRYAHQTQVYTPQNAGNFSTAELALPEAFTAAGSAYSMGSMGKWHLGGNTSAYNARGGWDEFYGIQGGGVQDYLSWNKNTNGTQANTTTYTTTDQANEAIAFINREEAAGNPWLCWVAFNAPHTPFHTPPAGLAPPGGYSTPATGNANLDNYVLMLEALDTEIGRLLASVPADTNIILIGDNGTPNQVVQGPFGNGNSKGDLYNGGIHVPMVAKGPILEPSLIGTTTDKLVHAVDLFSTLLELGGIDPTTVPGMPSTALAQSTSIVPILTNTDTADRCMVTEGGADAARGRAMILDDDPNYKMIIFGDPDNLNEDPRVEFYNVGAPLNDVNEQSPIYVGPHPLDSAYVAPTLNATEQAAWDALIAKDAALGGGFSTPGIVNPNLETLYFQLPTSNGTANVPNLNRPNGNPVHPRFIRVGGVDATWDTGTIPGTPNPTPASRVDTTDTPARYWVKFTFDPIAAGFDTNPGPHTVTVTYRVQMVNQAFDALTTYTYTP